ncbi:hypothetical protein [Halobacterium wangiae]|uniref:hypothetical protein n=1 Tax=Halobacterium wangiae TaxID=2902623 RepID=UPI001E4C5F9F|nr:hypothetical protein [Halobacterium wangiae]
MTELLDVAVLALQVAIVGTLLEAFRQRDVSAAVNALVVLVLAFLPPVVEFASDGSVTVDQAIALWLAAAGFLHSLGMLGLYEHGETWWWDHLTHTLSGALVAALLYAGLVVGVAQTPEVALSSQTIAGLTVLFTFAVGVFWELVELVAREVGERFDVEPVLVHYGRLDTALDLVFDVVGALLVVTLDLRLFVPLAEQFPETTRLLVLWSGGLVVVGSILMALGVGLAGEA